VLPALSVLLLAGQARPAAADPGPVTVQGRVTNGTAGAAVPPGIAVTVVQLDQDFTEIARRTVTAGPDGIFRSDGWDGKTGSRFVASADHENVNYIAAVTGDSGTLDVKLTIYEPTTDATVLRVASDTLTVVPGSGNVLEVLQIMRVGNGSDRTYVGTTPATPPPSTPSGSGSPDAPRPPAVLQLPVPAGAYDVTSQEGSQGGLARGTEGGIFTADPLSPGQTVVSFLYRVKVPSSGWALSRPVFYPTARSTVLLGPGLTLDADRFKFQGPVTLENRKYGRWDGPALAPGDQLAARIGSDRAGSGLVWGLWVALAAVLVAAVAVPLALRRRRKTAPRGSRAPGAGPSERARLVEEIAALDDALEAGSISEREHAERRGALKQRLISLTEATVPP
jgi:hypothetical protein